jgi:hypothetical protein
MAYRYHAAKTAEDWAGTRGCVFPAVGVGALVGVEAAAAAALTWFFCRGVGAGVPRTTVDASASAVKAVKCISKRAVLLALWRVGCLLLCRGCLLLF